MKWAANKKYSKKQWAVALIAIVVVLVVAAILMDHPPADISSATAASEIFASSGKAADTYITIGEYEQIKNGMTYDEVKAIIGSDGQNIFESGDKGTDSYSISYMWIGESGGEATIGFTGKDKLTVLMKSQSGLK